MNGAKDGWAGRIGQFLCDGARLVSEGFLRRAQETAEVKVRYFTRAMLFTFLEFFLYVLAALLLLGGLLVYLSRIFTVELVLAAAGAVLLVGGLAVRLMRR